MTFKNKHSLKMSWMRQVLG